MESQVLGSKRKISWDRGLRYRSKNFMETVYTKYGATVNNENLVIFWKNQMIK